jgi:hypothetical protein
MHGAIASLLTVVLGFSPTSATPAEPQHTDPASLPRGEAPHVTWLGGAMLHTAKGRDLGLPFPASRAPYLRLLGRAHHSWVVADLGPKQGWYSRVYRVHHGHYRTMLTIDNYYDRPTFQLARHGDQLATWDYDRGGTTATIYSWQARVLGQRSTEGFSQLLGFDGTEALVANRKVTRWTAGSAPVPFASSGSMADVDHDVLFVGRGKVGGPTTLSQPGEPRWTATFAPRSVSPDGTWVAGYTQESLYGKTRWLEIRSMADGALQPTTGLHLPPNAALAWEDSDHLLVGVRGDQGNAFVRCSVAGECERATDWLGNDAITVPHQIEYFFDWP